jgi:hypothetical protein
MVYARGEPATWCHTVLSGRGTAPTGIGALGTAHAGGANGLSGTTRAGLAAGRCARATEGISSRASALKGAVRSIGENQRRCTCTIPECPCVKRYACVRRSVATDVATA